MHIFARFSLSPKWIYFLECCESCLYLGFLPEVRITKESLCFKGMKADSFLRKHNFHSVPQVMSELDFPEDHFLRVSPIDTEPTILYGLFSSPISVPLQDPSCDSLI